MALKFFQAKAATFEWISHQWFKNIVLKVENYSYWEELISGDLWMHVDYIIQILPVHGRRVKQNRYYCNTIMPIAHSFRTRELAKVITNARHSVGWFWVGLPLETCL